MKSSPSTERAVVALFNVHDKICLLMTDRSPHNIVSFDSINKGLEYFTGGYNRCHNRGYSWSMSACINYTMFQPRVTQFESIQELTQKLIEGDPILVKIGNISGRYFVVECNGIQAKQVYDDAVSPQLITPKAF